MGPDPATAASSEMPSAAIERAGADRVMTLNDMAQALAGIAAATWPQDRMNETIKILVVDDVPRESRLPSGWCSRVRTSELLNARSGDEALELLLVHEVALALIDVRMPGMDGFELAELMRGTERTRAIPIIFMTAASQDPAAHIPGLRGRRAWISCTSRSIPSCSAARSGSSSSSIRNAERIEAQLEPVAARVASERDVRGRARP